MTEEDLRAIVAAASTLHERQTDAFVPIATGSDTLSDARLQAWCEAVAGGNQERFEWRLSRDGLDLQGARRLVGSVRLRPDSALPTWARTLQEALGAAGLQGSDGMTGDATRAEPFQHVLAPFVVVAEQRLAACAGSEHHRLGAGARRALRGELLRALAAHAAPTLQLEFAIFRAQAQSPWDRLVALALEGPERAWYDRFVERLLSGGLSALLREYAVLGRVLATLTELWVDANAEFLARLAADRHEIQRRFGGDRELERRTV